MSKARELLNLVEAKKVTATVVWFDSASGEGKADVPGEGKLTIKLPIHGTAAKQYDFSKIKEGGKIKVEINRDLIDEYGMIKVLPNK